MTGEVAVAEQSQANAVSAAFGQLCLWTWPWIWTVATSQQRRSLAYSPSSSIWGSCCQPVCCHSACSRWESYYRVFRLSCSAKPDVLCLQSCGACSPSLQLCCCSITMCHGPSLHWHGRRKLFLCDMHQDGALPNVLMKHLLQHRQQYCSQCCLDEFELNANIIIPKAVRDYCTWLCCELANRKTQKAYLLKFVTKRHASRAATPY